MQDFHAKIGIGPCQVCLWPIVKIFLRETLKMDVGLKLSNIGSEIVENCRAQKKFIFGSWLLIVDGSRSKSEAAS